MAKPKKSTGGRVGLSLKFEPSRENLEATLARQREWAARTADGIERGELPAGASERRLLASILRNAAAQLHIPNQSTRPGNPAFARKIPDDDTIPLMVAIRIKGRGESETEAIAAVADVFAVDESTIAKLYRRRRGAMLKHIERDIFVTRGAIRKE